jgi:hypothetical protein
LDRFFSDAPKDIVMLTRRNAMAALGGLPFVAGSGAASAKADDHDAFRNLEKAIWVWKFDWTRADELRAFALKHRIITLFVSLPAGVRAQLLAGDGKLVRTFRDFSSEGLQIWALSGDPVWLEQPTRLVEPVQDLLKIQERLQLFRGLHLDIEPHAHPQWRSGAAARARFAEALGKFFATVASRAQSLPIDAAIHPTIVQYTMSNGENALLALARHVSLVSIMAYRQTAVATIGWAAPVLDALKTMNIGWRMGVLVHPAKESDISFYQTSLTKFNEEMLELDRLLRAQADENLYRGLVFEDYNGLRGLLGT